MSNDKDKLVWAEDLPPEPKSNEAEHPLTAALLAEYEMGIVVSLYDIANKYLQAAHAAGVAAEKARCVAVIEAERAIFGGPNSIAYPITRAVLDNLLAKVRQ